MPRLTDFEPRWIDLPGRRGLGFSYRCTTGHCKGLNIVLFSNPLDGGPSFEGDSFELQNQLCKAGDDRHDDLHRGCGMCRWQRTGDTFETMTIAPSVDAHECGHFTVSNGEFRRS